jgi:lysophospholipase L1-like esterase
MAPKLLRVARTMICVASFCISVPVVSSDSLRSSFLLTVFRGAVWIWPHEYAFVGDSLTAQCNWGWHLGRPFSVVNLAVGGQGMNGVTAQIAQARQIGAKYLFIAAGINDIVLEHAPLDQIRYNFELALRSITPTQKAAVTLIPYVSNPVFSPAIEAANVAIRTLAERRGLGVIDLNPDLASDGIRKPEMTTDGVHFTPEACAVWLAAVKIQIARLNADPPARLTK